MPELISVLEFVNEANEDLNSPTTSTFVGKMGACRNVVSQLEEVSVALEKLPVNKDFLLILRSLS